MTDSNDGSPGTDDARSDEKTVDADGDLDALQAVSPELRSAQHRECETDESADVAENDREDVVQSDPDVPELDPDGLDKPAPVSSSLRSAQNQTGAGDAGMADDAGEDDDVDVSETDGR